MNYTSDQLFQAYTLYLEASKAKKESKRALVFCYAAIVTQIRHSITEEYRTSESTLNRTIYPDLEKKLKYVIEKLKMPIENSKPFFEESLNLTSIYLDEQLTEDECWDIIMNCFRNDTDKHIKTPDKDYKIFYQLYGTDCKFRKRKLEKYTFYPPNIDIKEYGDGDNNLVKEEGFFSKYNKHPYVSITIGAPDEFKAQEIALKKISRLEELINIVIKSYNKYYFNIIDIKDYKGKADFVLTDNELVPTGRYVLDSYVSLDEILDMEITKKLLEIFSKDKPTSMEKRILQSARWIGLGNKMGETPIGFSCHIIAIESLVTQKSGFEMPSITSQMKDAASYILLNDLESRKLLNKVLGELYSIRSSVVHGNEESKISPDDYHNAMIISFCLVESLLTNKQFIGMNEQILQDYITHQKYSLRGANIEATIEVVKFISEVERGQTRRQFVLNELTMH